MDTIDKCLWVFKDLMRYNCAESIISIVNY